MASCHHAGAGAANSVLVLNDQAACEAHFGRDRLAVPALSRVECSVSSHQHCHIHLWQRTIPNRAQLEVGQHRRFALRSTYTGLLGEPRGGVWHVFSGRGIDVEHEKKVDLGFLGGADCHGLVRKAPFSTVDGL
jgi:hypothetical protein